MCVILVVSLPLTLASQTENRFKVAVGVFGEDTHITNVLESGLKREFRLLGDVDIVEPDANWQFILTTQYLECEFMDGRKTGHIALATVFNEKIPDFYFKAN